MKRLKWLYKKLLSYIPTPLPVGLSDFNKFVDDIIELSGNYADRDSMAFAIASMVMHLGAQKSSVPKDFFVRSLRKAAANQVAGQVFTDIKDRQNAAALARAEEEKKAKLEATINSVASNEQKA